MSDNPTPSRAGNAEKNIRKLARDLEALNSKSLSEETGDIEMLTQILDEAAKGTDISTRYPDFYQKLLRNSGLRQLFLEALESLENASQEQEIEDLPSADLSFLKRQLQGPEISQPKKNTWQINWHRAIPDLQAIFSPSELAYRSDLRTLEDPWFTLLRGDVTVDNRTYSVILECSLSETSDEALSAFLNIALALTGPKYERGFPIQATLNWGDYRDSIRLDAEGRSRFSDIPFSAAFSGDLQTVASDLDLRLDILDPHA